MDGKKAIKEFEHLLNAARGNYFDFVDLTVDLGEEILAMLKEQDDLGEELANAVELIHKKNERIKELLKEQKAIEPKRKDISINDIDWFCGKCGHCVRRLDNYCSRCGKKVKWE